MRQKHGQPRNYSILFILLYIFIFCILGLRIFSRPFHYRYTFAAVSSDAVYIVSLAQNTESSVSLTFPKDTYVITAYGYGTYPVESLLALDTIEKKQGSLFTASLGMATGLPIDGYVVVEHIDSLFSWSTLFSVVSKKSQTNIPFPIWVRMFLHYREFRTGTHEVLDLTPSRYKELLADGTTSFMLDPQKVDFMIGTFVYDGPIRMENKSVAVYNTTDTPLVGVNVATMLKHVGISVLTVGNVIGEIKTCKLAIKKSDKKSLTVLFIKEKLSCNLVEEEDARHDIEVYLGQNNAQQYISH